MNYSAIFESMRLLITIFSTMVLTKYFLYLVIAPFYSVKIQLQKLRVKRLIRSSQISPVYQPLVSIIIPASNEEVGILSTVSSALANSYERLEIIVVNDGSTDMTDARVREFEKTYKKKPIPGKTIRYFSIPNGGKAKALNRGVSKAKGEIIMTMDADSVHEKNTVKNLVKYFQDPQIDAVVGNVKIGNASSLVGMIQKLEYIFGFYFKRVHSVFHSEYIFGGACAAFRKKTTFDSIGLFDSSTKTEDIEYSLRTQFHGLKSVYAEDVVAYTEGANSLLSLYKQRTRWKKGRIDVFIKYKKLFFSSGKRHPIFLSFVVLPYAALSDLQLLLEPLFVTMVWMYTLISGDLLSLGISSLFILFTFVSAILFGDKQTNRLYLFLFPSFWLIFYILVAVEFMALIKSLEMFQKGEDVTWQKWKRRGIGHNNSYLKVEA